MGPGPLTQTIFNAMNSDAGILGFEERGVAFDAGILTPRIVTQNEF